MKIVFYANCQFSGLQYLLDRHLSSVGVDADFVHIENYTLIKDHGLISEDILSSADVFIYQPIAAQHGEYSTDVTVANNILTGLRTDCIKVAFPYIYNSGLWPLVPPADIDSVIGGFGQAGQYLNRDVIERYADDGVTLASVLREYNRGQIDFHYLRRFEESLAVLRRKEASCDVKVADYIEENVRERRLFLTQNHPTTCLFVHCTNQILPMMGHEYSFDEDDFPENVGGFHKGWPDSASSLGFWRFKFGKIRRDDRFYRRHIAHIYRARLLEYIHPIAYSIPEERLATGTVQKNRVFAHLIPGDSSTYGYEAQDAYYSMYQEAQFGFTMKKGGWDCLRHYEILANKCIPYFLDLEECPAMSLDAFPKELVLEAMAALDAGSMNPEHYRALVARLTEHTAEHLTCRRSAERFLSRMLDRAGDSRGMEGLRVLMLNVSKDLNYSRELLSIGLRQVLGPNFIEHPRNEHIYAGPGFTYPGVVSDDAVDRTRLKSRIKAGEFDIVIAASVDPDRGFALNSVPFWRVLRRHYGMRQIAFLFGGDRSPFAGVERSTAGEDLLECLRYGVAFVREFGSEEPPPRDPDWRTYAKRCRLDMAPHMRRAQTLASTSPPLEPFSI